MPLSLDDDPNPKTPPNSLLVASCSLDHSVKILRVHLPEQWTDHA